jgi:hypothetical protein
MTGAWILNNALVVVNSLFYVMPDLIGHPGFEVVMSGLSILLDI